MRLRRIIFSILVFFIAGFTHPAAIFAQGDTLLPEPCGVDERGNPIGSCALEFNTNDATNTTAIIAPENENKVIYTLFHLETCPHCKDEIAFIEKEILPKYGNFLDVKMYEVSSKENRGVFQAYGKRYGVTVGSVPMAFIDGKSIQGYTTDQTSGKQILQTIERALIKKELIQGVASQEENFSLPILGTIDPHKISLPLLTLVLGLLDGFNPCAMWVLIFLITLLLGMKDKKRMWLLGSVFIITSGVAYFVFMAAWLQLILFIGFVTIIRVGIGLVAIGVGGLSLRDYWRNRNSDGVVCKVSKNNGATKIFEKIKDIVHRKSIWWSMLGILILGSSVNFVELACSAGFPAIFTQVLAINDVGTLGRYVYMIGYIFFYMLDDMIIFIIAMKTLSIAQGNNRYAKYANALSGALMLLLGLLLIFKPEWLMFT